MGLGLGLGVGVAYRTVLASVSAEQSRDPPPQLDPYSPDRSASDRVQVASPERPVVVSHCVGVCTAQPPILPSAPLSVSMQAGARATVDPPPHVQHIAAAVKSSSSYAASQDVEAQPNRMKSKVRVRPRFVSAKFVSVHAAERAAATETELVS